jgi:signal transduction histidine kinase
VLSADILNDPRHHNPVGGNGDSSVRAMISVPLKIKGNVIGVLNLADPHIDRFTEADLRFVEPIASAAAIAIENARLYTTAQQEITERKRAEAELRAANASKDKFFSIISHDLRSPFNALIGYTQLMFEDFESFESDQLKQNIGRVYKSAERLHALLENLLTWSRIQRGVMEYNPEEFDLQEIAENNIDLFLSKAEQKQVRLQTNVQEGMEVYADYNMTNTVIRNLLSNALKFTPTDGMIEISAQNQGNHLEISISDTGTGIPEEAIPKLFRIDLQYTNVGVHGERGTGLGLILCQDLLKKNGGKIWVESEVGKGTTFRFTLPTRQEKQ